MTGKPDDIQTLIEQKKQQLLKEAAAKIERDMAEFARLAVEYPDLVSGLKLPAANQSPPAVEPAPFAGHPSPRTIHLLVKNYTTNFDSPYFKLTHKSRVHYDHLMKQIERDHGPALLKDVDGQMLESWYADLSRSGKIGIVQSKMTMLRTLLSFGNEILKDEDCARLWGFMAKMKIDAPKARTQLLTVDQASLIRAKAHELKRPSIALAQAFQSEVGLLQKDVIGEWVPMPERSAPSDVIFCDDEQGIREKWIRGLRWNEIDENLILRHPTGDGKTITFDLRTSPMVMDELRRQFGFEFPWDRSLKLETSGPIIKSEWSGLPWSGVEYRRWWRICADACGISREVRSADSRRRRLHKAAEADSEDDLAKETGA